MPVIHELIELPSEANPLNPQTLFKVLSGATSTDQQQVKTAALQLQNWEKEPGYYSGLQTVLIDTSLPFEVRYLAVIQIKNGIDKYWRKTAQKPISKEEKALIRSRCLELGVSEPDHRLALHNAIVISKIARFEYPHDWPDVITSVTNFLQESSRTDSGSAHLPRTLLILLYIIKELSTAKLQRSRINLQKAAPDIFRVLSHVYLEKVNKWMNFLMTGGNNEADAINSIDLSLLSLRVLRRLIICGFDNPNRHDEIQEFWNMIRVHFGEMLALVTQHGQSLQDHIRGQIEKHLIQMSKFHLEMARVHPAAYPQLQGAIEIAKAYWGLLVEFGKTFGTDTAIMTAIIGTDGDAEDEISCIEKLSLKGLLLIRACTKMVYTPTQTFKYQSAADKVERKESTDSMKSKLLSQDLVREMMETLVTRFFVFRLRDLRQWEEEPGEWERREEGEGETWEFSIRTCAEKLFLELVINNKDLLIQPLLSVFHTVATPDNTDILLKDSIYAAIGLAAPVLDKHLDFNAFLNSTLVPEVQIQRPGYNILRRRVAILLGQWAPIAEMDKALVYQIFQFLLNKEEQLNDLVVRVTAGRQLNNALSPFDMQVTKFTPYAEVIVNRLMAVVQEVELPETKIALLNTLSSLVIRMEHHITPYAPQIVSFLPPLWDQAGDDYLLKQTILGILSAIITSMKADSHQFHSIILPLISSSVAEDSNTRIFLLEDALELWTAILTQTSQPSPDILGLTAHLFPLYQSASENLKKSFELTEGYILLAPQALLEASPRFATVFSDLLSSNLKREANGIIATLVELLVRSAHALSGDSGVQHLAEILVRTEFLPALLTGLKSAHDSHQTTGPHRPFTDIDGIVETDYFAVLARILFYSPHSFVQAIVASSQTLGEVRNWLLTEWFSHFENTGNTARKKLFCLALTKLMLAEDRPDGFNILSRLQELMGIWTETVSECMEYNDDGEGRDTLVYSTHPEFDTGVPESPDEVRRRLLLYSDPVHQLNIKDYLREHLQQAIAVCGGSEEFQREWLVNVDADVVKSFGALGVL